MKSFLLVEDDTGHAELMRRALEDAGHAVVVVGLVAEAQREIVRRPPVLALVDHHLPDGAGSELIAAVGGAFPILLMTAHGDEQLAVDALKAGAMDYLVKSPAMFAELPHTVERALREWGLEVERRRALRALHESEERYRRITEGLTDYLYSVRVGAGRAVATTHGPACVAVTGYTAEEFAADPLRWIDMVVPEDRARVIAHVERVVAGERRPAVEHRIVRKDGVTRWVSDTSILHFDADGRLVGYDGVVRDITERKASEDAMRQSEERYRAVVELCPEAVFVEAEGRIIFANEAAAALTRAKTAGSLVGREILELVQPEFRDLIEQRRHRLATEAGYVAPLVAVTGRRLDGSTVDVMIMASQLKFNERPARLIMAMDVTAQRRTEASLRKLSRAVEQSPVTVIITDATGAIEYVNPSFTKTSGYTFAEVRGLNPRILASGQTPPEMYRDLWRAITAGREWRGEFHNCKKDGELFWETATISPIADERGRITHFLAVKEDITERKRAEAALAASEQRFRLLVENVPNIAVQGYDWQRRVVFWNAASTALYGYTREEALGRQLEDLIIPVEMREGVIAAVEGFVTRNEPIPAGELVLRRKDGSPVSVYSSHVKLERPDGEFEMHCIDIDLTARKEAERALAASNEFHLRILSDVPAMIWRSGPEGECDWFSDRWLTFTGRPMAENLGDGWVGAVHADDVARCLATYRAAFGARQPFEMEYGLRRADGEYRLISDSGRPFLAPAGDFGGFIGYCVDITERRRADRQIREQAALLDAAHEAILVIDLDHAVSYWNRAAERLYEIPAAEARGQRIESLVLGGRPDNFGDAWEAVRREGVWSGERQHVARSGRRVDVRIQATRVRSTLRDADTILVVITDITESNKLEAQYLRAQRLESLGALASGVAHDLNNVLTPMLMSVELLRPLAVEKSDQDMLQLLNDSARRGADIVQQLLLFGRGSVSPRAPLNAGDILKEVGKMMRQTFPKNLVLSVQAPADLGLIEADRTQMHQVVLNLCVNARDAMPHGGRLTLSAENRRVEDNLARSNGGSGGGDYVLINVKDSGVGIPAAHLEKIFDPFFTTKAVGEGTGLGLATVLGIVRSHGGFLVVTSEVGRGTEFEVYLPVARAKVEALVVADESPVLRGRGECVLVVEDEEGIRLLLQRLLTANNYPLLMASDGAEALGIFAQNAANVKLVITDVMMPVMDGAQMMSVLRRLNPDLPVVAISGLSSHRAEFERKFGPRVRFLPKPFPSDLALRLVREALDEK